MRLEPVNFCVIQDSTGQHRAATWLPKREFSRGSEIAQFYCLTEGRDRPRGDFVLQEDCGTQLRGRTKTSAAILRGLHKRLFTPAPNGQRSLFHGGGQGDDSTDHRATAIGLDIESAAQFANPFAHAAQADTNTLSGGPESL